MRDVLLRVTALLAAVSWGGGCAALLGGDDWSRGEAGGAASTGTGTSAAGGASSDQGAGGGQAGASVASSGGSGAVGGGGQGGASAGGSGGAFCGNGVVDGSEECDDGNGTTEDGCGPDCVTSCPPVATDPSFGAAGHCYWIATAMVDWLGAGSTCNTAGYHLVTIEGPAEETLIENMIMGAPGTVWTGANDQVNEGVFVWEDGDQPVSFFDWGADSPDPTLTNTKDCVMLTGTTIVWQDLPCNYGSRPLCELP